MTQEIDNIIPYWITYIKDHYIIKGPTKEALLKSHEKIDFEDELIVNKQLNNLEWFKDHPISYIKSVNK